MSNMELIINLFIFVLVVAAVDMNSMQVSAKEQVDPALRDEMFGESIGPCKDHTCQNEGICTIENEKAVCECVKPYWGKFCEIDPCTNYTCQNGGNCDFRSSYPKCNCNKPYYGEFCQYDPCTNNFCKNGGSCTLVDKIPRCNCETPFWGEFCEKDPCTNYTCQNGGCCEFRNSNPKCSCHKPYYGEFCQHDPCTHHPCMNKGKCRVEDQKAICDCSSPYKGVFCEIDSGYEVLIAFLTSLIFFSITQLACGICILKKVNKIGIMVTNSGSREPQTASETHVTELQSEWTSEQKEQFTTSKDTGVYGLQPFK